MKNPTAKIRMKNQKEITIELFPEVAPNTVNNFINLAKNGFYNGIMFHRVIEGFMIQGGDPEGLGIGGPGYTIRGEFSINGFNNNLKHDRGVISMARSQDYNSAGSQFFIMHRNAPHLDGSYAAFGKVIDGFEAVDEIASTPTNSKDRPLNPQVMEIISIDLNDYKYTEPSIMK